MEMAQSTLPPNVEHEIRDGFGRAWTPEVQNRIAGIRSEYFAKAKWSAR